MLKLNSKCLAAVPRYMIVSSWSFSYRAGSKRHCGVMDANKASCFLFFQLPDGENSGRIMEA